MSSVKGNGIVSSIRRTGNKVDVPLTRQLGLFDFAKKVGKQLGEDHVGAFAGNLVYHALFALFPFLALTLSLLGVFNATGVVDSFVQMVRPVLPGEAVTLLEQQILAPLLEKNSGVASIGALLSLAVAVWGVSGGMRSLMQALNVMYEVEEGRSFVKRYALSILLAVAATIGFIGAMAIAVIGPQVVGLADSLGIGPVGTVLWQVLQWPVMVLLVMVTLALLYWVAPNIEQPFKLVSPGSVVATAGWLLFSLGFSLYVNNFGSYDATYGSLAGVVIFMLYLYFSAFILLVGAEINQVIEDHSPHGEATQQDADNDNPGGNHDNRTQG